MSASGRAEKLATERVRWMCGRFYILAEEAGETVVQEIFPTQEVEVLTRYGRRRMRWGIPQIIGKGVMINARAETVAVKPMYSRSFATNRCLVPAQGFYEWLHQEDKKTKDKYRLDRADGEKMMMAGIYNEQGQFVIITQPPNETVKPLHDRMPVVMPSPEIQELWLHADSLAEPLLTMNLDVAMCAEQEPVPESREKNGPLDGQIGLEI